jgi:hypothetical protein
MSQVYKLTLRHEDSIDAMASIASSLPRATVWVSQPLPAERRGPGLLAHYPTKSILV